MKANFYTESILYWLARSISALAQKLPPRWNVRLGAGAGTLLYWMLGSRKRVARDNLRAAFQSTYTPQQYEQILLKMFQNFGRTFMEIGAIPRVDRAYMDHWVPVAPGSRERLKLALSRGKGVIFLTGHFGNWELVSLSGALNGFPSLVLAREQGLPRLNRLLTQYRESKGCKVITKGFAVRELIQGLKEQRTVGILADQDGGRKGIFADYLGRISSTASGPIALHFSTGAPILPVFMVRQGGPFHQMIAEEPLIIPDQGTEQERLQAGIAAYLAVLEKYVRAYPEQWLWLHRRWKSCPERRVLIFSDGKAGHLSQCLGLAGRIETVWNKKVGGDPRLKILPVKRPLVSTRMVEVRYRHPFWKPVLSCVAAVSGKHPSGGGKWLRWALTPESYRSMASLHADISISCGSSSAPVNRLWAGMIRCKTVHLTKNAMPSWKSFDLAILPAHDFKKRPSRKKLVLTDLALAPRRRFLQAQVSAWRAALGLRAPRVIGLMLGGSAPSLVWTDEQIVRVAEQVSRFAERHDAEFLVTSSRRTGETAEALLEKLLKTNPRCRLLTLAGRNDPDRLKTTSEAVDAILACAQTVVVSGDSISMVSEAAARGTGTAVIFPPDALAGNSKQRRFAARLEHRRKIRVSDPDGVSNLLEEIALMPSAGSETIEPESSNDPVEEFLQGWL